VDRCLRSKESGAAAPITKKHESHEDDNMSVSSVRMKRIREKGSASDSDVECRPVKGPQTKKDHGHRWIDIRPNRFVGLP